jgi:hypothetical protein
MVASFVGAQESARVFSVLGLQIRGQAPCVRLCVSDDEPRCPCGSAAREWAGGDALETEQSLMLPACCFAADLTLALVLLGAQAAAGGGMRQESASCLTLTIGPHHGRVPRPARHAVTCPKSPELCSRSSPVLRPPGAPASQCAPQEACTGVLQVRHQRPVVTDCAGLAGT